MTAIYLIEFEFYFSFLSPSNYACNDYTFKFKTYLNALTLRVFFPDNGHIYVQYQNCVQILFFGISGVENVDIISKLEVLKFKIYFLIMTVNCDFFKKFFSFRKYWPYAITICSEGFHS